MQTGLSRNESGPVQPRRGNNTNEQNVNPILEAQATNVQRTWRPEHSFTVTTSSFASVDNCFGSPELSELSRNWPAPDRCMGSIASSAINASKLICQPTSKQLMTSRC